MWALLSVSLVRSTTPASRSTSSPSAGHQRAEGSRSGSGSRRPRRDHRAREPPPPRQGSSAGCTACAERYGHRGGDAAARPRPLQGRQRHARPPRRRRPAEPGGPAAAPPCAAPTRSAGSAATSSPCSCPRPSARTPSASRARRSAAVIVEPYWIDGRQISRSRERRRRVVQARRRDRSRRPPGPRRRGHVRGEALRRQRHLRVGAGQGSGAARRRAA